MSHWISYSYHASPPIFYTLSLTSEPQNKTTNLSFSQRCLLRYIYTCVGLCGKTQPSPTSTTPISCCLGIKAWDVASTGHLQVILTPMPHAHGSVIQGEFAKKEPLWSSLTSDQSPCLKRWSFKQTWALSYLAIGIIWSWSAFKHII